jgi:hypothetical protein
MTIEPWADPRKRKASTPSPAPAVEVDLTEALDRYGQAIRCLRAGAWLGGEMRVAAENLATEARASLERSIAAALKGAKEAGFAERLGAERQSPTSAADAGGGESDREALRQVCHALGVCYCWDYGCEPGPLNEVLDRIRDLTSREGERIDAEVAGASGGESVRDPTHRCTACGALWIKLPATPLGGWSLWSKRAGPCCDNVEMGEQIEPLTSFKRNCDPGPWGEPPPQREPGTVPAAGIAADATATPADEPPAKSEVASDSAAREADRAEIATLRGALAQVDGHWAEYADGEWGPDDPEGVAILARVHVIVTGKPTCVCGHEQDDHTERDEHDTLPPECGLCSCYEFEAVPARAALAAKETKP